MRGMIAVERGSFKLLGSLDRINAMRFFFWRGGEEEEIKKYIWNE